MSILPLALLVLGLALLVAGAELLVRGASRIARMAGISPLVVGLTVVAYGTSSPEAAVSIGAAWKGHADLAVANVVGSNVFNVLFILGACALAAPLVVSRQLVRFDVPVMIGSSLLLWGMASDGQIGRIDAAVLFAGTISYTAWLVVQSRRESAAAAAASGEPAPPTEGRGKQIVAQVALVLSGLVLLVLGARWLVDGATTMARAFGVSDVVIGLTIVAAGTSLPEVATSLVATLRGERDIAIGNVIGSNIGNILAVLGLSGLVARGGLPVSGSLLPIDIPVMVLVAAACFPIFLGRRVERWHGVAFLGYYAAYTAFLVLNASGSSSGAETSQLVARLAIPSAGLILSAILVQNLRRPAAEPEGPAD